MSKAAHRLGRQNSPAELTSNPGTERHVSAMPIVLIIGPNMPTVQSPRNATKDSVKPIDSTKLFDFLLPPELAWRGDS